MRFWWVNHKKTVDQEVSGGYLWSPKLKSNGARNQFYDNMRAASPGDAVISFADGWIRYIGTVADRAVSFRKPEEFGRVGTAWAADGWLLPVSWHKVPTPIRPQDHVQQLRPLLPKTHSPIRGENAHGNQGAYLASISEDLFEKVLSLAALDFSSAPVAASAKERENLDDEVARQVMVDDLSSTEKQQQMKARLGQGAFRDNVLNMEPCCRVTGLDDPTFLIASHIKPWRSCETSLERLDGNNGLMLTPSVDRLFDRGYITFDSSGRLRSSIALAREVELRMGLIKELAPTCSPLSEKQESYMQWHRENVFITAASA